MTPWKGVVPAKVPWVQIPPTPPRINGTVKLIGLSSESVKLILRGVVRVHTGPPNIFKNNTLRVEHLSKQLRNEGVFMTVELEESAPIVDVDIPLDFLF